MKKRVIPPEAEILRDKRLELDMTQMDAANMACIQLRQYQRPEYGDFRISRTGMKVGLTVCRVLEPDPFLFVDHKHPARHHHREVCHHRRGQCGV